MIALLGLISPQMIAVILGLVGIGGFYAYFKYIKNDRARLKGEVRQYQRVEEIHEQQDEVTTDVEQKIEKAQQAVDSGDIGAIMAEFGRVRDYARQRNEDI